ncbi:MAG: hypothetical protein AAFY67_12935 [Cyanobacteria bacterium J06642_9]
MPIATTRMHIKTSRSESQNPQPNSTWVRCTEAGNRQMQLGDLKAAQSFYRKALALAEKLIQPTMLQCQQPTSLIHLYLVSCNNLADSCQVLREPEEAEVSLLKAHSRMIVLMNNEGLSSPTRQAAYHGLRRAFNRLASFYSQTQKLEALTKVMVQTKLQSRRFVDNLVL